MSSLQIVVMESRYCAKTIIFVFGLSMILSSISDFSSRSFGCSRFSSRRLFTRTSDCMNSGLEIKDLTALLWFFLACSF